MSLNIPRRIGDQKFVYLDQAVVSGTNFVTSLILARVLGLVEFGIYSLFFIILIFILSVHHSLFGAPMLVVAPKIRGRDNRFKYLFTLNTLQVLFCLLLAIIIGSLGLVVSRFSFLIFDTSILIPFCLCVVFSPMQEWLRRFFFVIGKSKHAFFADSTKSFLQIGCILGLIYFDTISIWSIYVAIAFSSITTYVLFVVLFGVRLELFALEKVWQKNWQQGMYLLPVNVMEWVNSQGFIVLASFSLGPGAAGAIKAAMNALGPLNILSQAVENIFPVEGARHLKLGGIKRMSEYFRTVSLQSLLYFCLPCLFMGIFAKPIMTFLYGDAFSSYYMLVVFHLVSLLLCYYYRMLASLLRVLDLSRVIFTSMIIGTLTIVLFSMPIASQYAENGVMVLKNIAELSILIFLLFKVRSVLVHKTG